MSGRNAVLKHLRAMLIQRVNGFRGHTNRHAPTATRNNIAAALKDQRQRFRWCHCFNQLHLDQAPNLPTSHRFARVALRHKGKAARPRRKDDPARPNPLAIGEYRFASGQSGQTIAASHAIRAE